MAMVFTIPNAVTFESVMALCAKGCQALEQMPDAQMHVDFSSLVHFDSCALALMISLQRKAQSLVGKQLTFVNLPAKLQQMAVLGKLDQLLPIA